MSCATESRKTLKNASSPLLSRNFREKYGNRGSPRVNILHTTAAAVNATATIISSSKSFELVGMLVI